MRKILVPAFIALSLVASSVAMAATTTTTPAVVIAVKADVLPVDKLDPLIGKWTQAELADLLKSKSVKSADIKMLYNAADQKTIEATATKMKAELGELRMAIESDKALKAWFVASKVDVNRLVAISDVKGAVELFLL